MPADPPTPDDRPLTVTEVRQFSAPNHLLARKIAPHLGPAWEAAPSQDGSLRALLLGPHGETLVAYATLRRGEWEAVIRTLRPLDLPEGFGHFHWNGLDVPLATAPSQIARHIEADVLPAYRTTLTGLREELARIKADQERLRERADVLAARLGLDWRVKEHEDPLATTPRSYFTVERNTQQKQIFGTFTIDQGRRGTGITLCNVDGDTLDTIVEAVVRGQEADPHRRKRWPKNLKRALSLMHQAGYSIDRIGTVHRHLFGEYLFKMDSRVGVGYSVVTYLRERPNVVQNVIKLLDPEGPR